jgi:hypothetical protein
MGRFDVETPLFHLHVLSPLFCVLYPLLNKEINDTITCHWKA